MCGIVGSSDQRRLYELGHLIAERGTKNFSLSAIDLNQPKVISIVERPNEFSDDILRNALIIANIEVADYAKITENIDVYYILHLQSPTSSTFQYHPARKFNTKSYLWHNGMMDSRELKKLKIDGKLPWDTKVFLDMIDDSELNWTSALESFQGSFACVYLKEKEHDVYAFKNLIAPLSIDTKDMRTICSVPFRDSVSLLSNSIYSLKDRKTIDKFNNTYNPFGIKE